jgi:hypothetical protein
MAILMVGLLAILALVLDGGRIYLERRRVQNAADAGALAGTRTLALGGTANEAQVTAMQYVLANEGASSANITMQTNGLTVRACKNVAMTFARVIGLDATAVCANASAVFGPIGSAVGLAPIAVRDFAYTYYTPYSIWDDDKDRDPISGQISGAYRGWLSLNCVYPMNCGTAGASLLKDWMQNGYQSQIDVDDWVRGDSGVKASVIQQAYVGQVLRMIIYDAIEDKYNNKSYYHVIKFAAFQVTDVKATGNPKGITGFFLYYFTPGPPSGEEDGGWRCMDLTE